MSPSAVVYLPGARDDLDAAYLSYEQQRAGLGARFAVAVRDPVARVQNNPLLYGTVYQDVRGAPVRRFPYIVYYRVESGPIVVVAVQHGRRQWSNWLGRV